MWSVHWPPACRSGGGRPGRTAHQTPSLCAPAEAPARRTLVVKHPQPAPLAPRPLLAPVSARPATLGLHQVLPCLEVPLWLWCVGRKDRWKLFSRRGTHCRAQAWRGSRCQIALPRGLAPIILTWGPWALILTVWGRGTQSVQRAGRRRAPAWRPALLRTSRLWVAMPSAGCGGPAGRPAERLARSPLPALPAAPLRLLGSRAMRGPGGCHPVAARGAWRLPRVS